MAFSILRVTYLARRSDVEKVIDHFPRFIVHFPELIDQVAKDIVHFPIFIVIL